MQSKLEKNGIEERKNEILKSDYNIEDQYSATHKNALATGDGKGRGDGKGGHTHWSPNISQTSGYKNDNFYTEEGGNSYDVEERKIEMNHNLYTAENDYLTKHYSNQGKGTGHGGHTHWLPNADATSPTTINYSNFDTENGGNIYDKEGRNNVGGREKSIKLSLYNKENQYSINLIDSEENQRQGQYKM